MTVFNISGRALRSYLFQAFRLNQYSKAFNVCRSARYLSTTALNNATATKTTNPNAVLRKDILSLFQSPPAENSPINIQGWVKSVRILKKVAFVDISDGTTHNTLMAVTSPEAAKKIKTGMSVETVGGIWIKSKGQNQSFELKVKDLNIIGLTEENYPLQKKYHSAEFIRSLPILKFRTSKLSSVVRTRSFLEYKLLEFFQQENFIKVSPPLITSSDCEGAGELFQVESASILQKHISDLLKIKTSNSQQALNTNITNPFFGKQSFLTVSTQLHLEILAQSLRKVWTLSPSFRAEASDTNRHLSEFWMLEAEMAYVDNVNQLTYFCERMIKHVINAITNNENHSLDNLVTSSKRPKEELIEIENRLKTLQSSAAQKNWFQITYNEAIDILLEATEKHGKKWDYLPPVRGDSLSTEHEKYLTNEVFKNAVFVTDYPRDEKAFYMKANNDADNTVACFDLLLPVMGELIGGSVREENYDTLLLEMQRRKMNVEDLNWYLHLRKNGSVPHGGFGMGFERLVSYICNVDNIKDTVILSRSVNNCDC